MLRKLQSLQALWSIKQRSFASSLTYDYQQPDFVKRAREKCELLPLILLIRQEAADTKKLGLQTEYLILTKASSSRQQTRKYYFSSMSAAQQLRKVLELGWCILKLVIYRILLYYYKNQLLLQACRQSQTRSLILGMRQVYQNLAAMKKHVSPVSCSLDFFTSRAYSTLSNRLIVKNRDGWPSFNLVWLSISHYIKVARLSSVTSEFNFISPERPCSTCLRK